MSKEDRVNMEAAKKRLAEKTAEIATALRKEREAHLEREHRRERSPVYRVWVRVRDSVAAV